MRDTDRNNLPVLSSQPTQWQLDRESYMRWLPLKMLMFYAGATFAFRQFSKAYFPLGIILRNSIPQTMSQKVMQRAPVGVFFAFLWYSQREYPRRFRIDLTDPTEN